MGEKKHISPLLSQKHEREGEETRIKVNLVEDRKEGKIRLRKEIIKGHRGERNET